MTNTVKIQHTAPAVINTTLGVGSSANLLTAFSNASAVSIVVPALTSNPSSNPVNGISERSPFSGTRLPSTL